MPKKKDTPLEVGEVYKLNSLELETEILSIILNNNNAINEINEILKPEHFYYDFYKKAFEKCNEIYYKNIDISVMTLAHELKIVVVEMQINHIIPELTKCMTKTIGNENIKHRALMLIELYLRRELITTTIDVQNKALKDDIFDVYYGYIKDLQDKLNNLKLSQIETIKQLMAEIVVTSIQLLQTGQEKGLRGFLTNYTIIDNYMNGIKIENLIIIAARTSVGKTAFSLNVANNLSIHNDKANILIISLEMSKFEIAKRFIAMSQLATLDQINNNSFSIEDIGNYIEEKKNERIFINDKSTQNIDEIRTLVKREQIENRINIVIIDYLQLINPDENNLRQTREQQVSKITRECKLMAKDLKISLILLSQVSRSTTMEANKSAPKLYQLRESGSIEQDADSVIILHRNEEMPELLEVNIAKNRDGQLQQMDLIYNKKNQIILETF